MTESVEMVKCPSCDVKIRAGDVHAQKAHMELNHPDVIARRLQDAGFRQQPDGSWLDTLC
jgi:hypothetical protein